MGNIVKDLEEIFEVEELDLNLEFKDLEEWDSLSVLSTLALLDSDYGISLTKEEIEAFSSINVFIEYVNENAR